MTEAIPPDRSIDPEMQIDNTPKGLGSRLLRFGVEIWWMIEAQVVPVLIDHSLCNDIARELGVVDEYTYSNKRSGRWRNFISKLRGSEINNN